MNQMNLNTMVVKEVRYDASLANASVLNFTVENCNINAFIQKIVIYLNAPDPTFAATTQLTLQDRGHTYPGSINGFIPITYASIGTSSLVSSGGTNIYGVMVQVSSTVVEAYVNQSTQDTEGIGNIYVKLTRTGSSYSVGFTMAVFYRPESTFNSKLNTRNQASNDAPMRVLSQAGVTSFAHPASVMTEQTWNIAKNVNPRNNVDTTTFGFGVSSNSPFFYFGTPYKTRRWFVGFSSDNTPNVGIVTFSYYNGTNFTSFSTVYSGALGPGTYQFANDGVIIFAPPADWKPLVMQNDPLTIYNNNIIRLAQDAPNQVANNPNMYWVQCRVGFSSLIVGVNTNINIATVVPLIDPDLPLTFRRRLIPS
jgi:hypothetical protein